MSKDSSKLKKTASGPAAQGDPPPSSWRAGGGVPSFRVTRGHGKGFGRPGRVITNTILIFLISQFLAAFIIGLTLAVTHHGHAEDIFNSSTLAQFFYVLIAEGLAAWLVFRLLKRRELKPAGIGLGRRPTVKDLKWAIKGAVFFYALAIVGSIVLSLFVSQTELDKQQDLGFNNLITNSDYILAFVSLVILPPLAEETLVRGYLYSGLRKSMKFWPALVITSIFFGLAHLNGGTGGSTVWAAAIDTFILSGVLVYVREYSGALYAGMLIHATNNLVAFFIHFK